MRHPRSPELTVLGQVLRRLRRERDLSQEALAAKAGLTANHVSELERARSEPGITTFMSIARALGLTAAELMERLEEQLAAQGGSAQPA